MLNTEHLVKSALASTLNFSDIVSIDKNHHLKKDLQLDSMSSLMFLMKLEETIDGFYVDPETLQMQDLETVSSVVRYINMQMLSKDAHVH
ncbi:MAG: hypothetical protein ACD_29C00097G0004 [uncultured bacterium]|nr:MAG: hypothetical protein ACD_29C00097G0004 [uncultured bacterium]